MKKWLSENNKILLIIVGFILILSSFTNLDQDLYWHLKNGEYIINNGISNTDHFSYWGGNFISHEWLYDILLFSLFKIDGLRLIKIVSFIAIGISMFLSFKVFAKKSNNGNIFINIVPIILWATGRILLEARPQIASLLSFCLVIYLLETNKHIWSIPIITLLTANLHGGMSLLVLIVPVIYLISYIFDSEKVSKEYIIKLIGIICISFLTLGITPYGFKNVTYGFTMPNWVYDRIAEWQVIIKGISDSWILVIMILPLFSMIISKKATVKDILFFCMGLILTFIHLRMVLIFVPIYIMFGSQYLLDLINIFRNQELKEKKDVRFNKIFNANIILLVLCLIVSYNISTINFQLIEKTSESSPVIIKEYIENNEIDVENNIMFNEYGYGGYFIFNNIPVFIDGRADVYLEEYGNQPIFKDYQLIWDRDEQTDELIEKYNIQYWAIPKNGDLYKYLTQNSKAKVLTEDSNFAFLRTEGGENG